MITNLIDEELKKDLRDQGVIATTLQEVYNWGRRNSLWPLQFGLACCAIEMIAAGSAARYSGRRLVRRIS